MVDRRWSNDRPSTGGSADMTTGPTKLTGPQHYRGLDGRWHHVVRQSDVNRFRQCPDLHRRHLLGLNEEWQNDSAAIGQAFGVFVDACLTHGDYNEALTQGQVDLTNSYNNPRLRTVQIYGGYGEAISLYHHLCDTFRDVLWQNYPPSKIEGIEVPFKHKVYEDEQRVIEIQGTRDLDITDEIVDWKTSSKEYSGRNAWQHERYDVQPVLYVWARMLEEDKEGIHSPRKDMFTFRYVVIHRDPVGPKDDKRYVDELPIKVTWNDIDFLLEEIKVLCLLIEAELPKWPLGPTDWHCSSKWCPAWKDCRGKYLGDDPWKLMENVELKVKQHKTPFEGLPN